MPAYAVNDFDAYEPKGTIVFAKSNIVARRLGASELDCDEIAGLSCKRAHWADEFESDGVVPAAIMVEHGWHLECSGCLQQIYQGGTIESHVEDDDGNEKVIEIDVNPVGTQHMAFCTPECRDREIWRRAWMKRGDRRCFEVFKRELLRLHPGVTIDPVSAADDRRINYHHCYFGHHSKSRRGRALCFVVKFSFPGSQYGGSYRYDLDYDAIKGKRQVLIANADQSAWAEFSIAQKEEAA